MKLNKAKELLKTWLMRGTVHIIPTREYPIYHNAIQTHRLDLWSKFIGKSKFHQQLSRLGPSIIEALSSGPLSREELHERIPQLKRIPGASWGLDIKGLCYEGKVVFAGKDGQHSKFATLTGWFGTQNMLTLTTSDAHATLVRRYLHGYGPATEHDYRYWSGLPAGTVHTAFQSLATELEAVRVGVKRSMFLLKADLDRLESFPECVGLRLLPKYDPYVMGHFDKTRFLSEEYRRLVFRKAAVVESTVVSNGHVVGTWRYSANGPSLKVGVNLFTRIPKADIDLLHREVAALAKMLGKETSATSIGFVSS